MLIEKLEPDQMDVVSTWDLNRPKSTQDAIDKVYGGESKLEYPLSHHEVLPHPDVESHLNAHGYSITNYHEGKAKDKFNRETNIGKALNKTNADSQVVAAYENDPSRQQQKRHLTVEMTQDPYDVAGMTSRCHSWSGAGGSCMDFDTGANKHYLPHEVREGTQLAFLKDGDHELARIALKPYHSDSGHTIFRPEPTVYGSASGNFHKQVSDWAEEHYPAHENTVYLRNRHVQSNLENRSYTKKTDSMLDKYIGHGVQLPAGLSRENTQYVANKLLNGDVSLDSFAQAKHNVDFDRNQVNKLYSMAKDSNQHGMTKWLAYRAGDTLNKDNLQDAATRHLDSPSVMGHRYLPAGVVDSLPLKSLSLVHPANIRPEHLDRMIDEYPAGVFAHAKKLTLPQVHRIVSNPIHLARLGKSALSNPNADKGVFDTALNTMKSIPAGHERNDVMDVITQHIPVATAEHVPLAETETALGHIMSKPDGKVTHNLALHKVLRKGFKPAITHPEYVSDDDIPALYDSGAARHSDLPSSIHEKLLTHSIKMADTHDDPVHLQRHADMIMGKLDSMSSALAKDKPIDGDYYERLPGHIDQGLNHPSHDGTHDDLHYEHERLMR